MKRIVLKISSGLIVNKTIQEEWLKGLSQLIAELQKKDIKIWLVTSGALAMYKHKNNDSEIISDKAYREGQKYMFNLYKKIFLKSNLNVSEVLLSKDDFKDRNKYLSLRDQLEKISSNKYVALINEKENINSEHKFSDNDEIAGLMASVLNADIVIFASTVSGVIDSSGRCISEVKFNHKFWTKFVNDKVSENGRGGMLLKCQAAEHSAQRGIDSVICDGTDMGNIRRIIKGEKSGTKFIADRRKVAKKRWIFDKKDFSGGYILVDKGLSVAIRNGQTVSLLSIGVEAVSGDFEENGVVAIRDRQGILGYGESKYNSKDVRRLISDQERKLLIHYDQYMRIV